ERQVDLRPRLLRQSDLANITHEADNFEPGALLIVREDFFADRIFPPEQRVSGCLVDHHRHRRSIIVAGPEIVAGEPWNTHDRHVSEPKSPNRSSRYRVALM